MDVRGLVVGGQASVDEATGGRGRLDGGAVMLGRAPVIGVARVLLGELARLVVSQGRLWTGAAAAAAVVGGCSAGVQAERSQGQSRLHFSAARGAAAQGGVALIAPEFGASVLEPHLKVVNGLC